MSSPLSLSLSETGKIQFADLLATITTKRILVLHTEQNGSVVIQQWPQKVIESGEEAYRWTWLNIHGAYCGSYTFDVDETKRRLKAYFDDGTLDDCWRGMVDDDYAVAKKYNRIMMSIYAPDERSVEIDTPAYLSISADLTDLE